MRIQRNGLGRGQPAQCRGPPRHGHGAAPGQWREANTKYMDEPPATGRGRRPERGLKVLRIVLQSGVLGLGAYLVIQQAGDRRHHHRELDPRRARARAGGAGDRQLEGLRRGTPELAAAVRAAACACRAEAAADAAAARRRKPGCRDGHGHAAGRATLVMHDVYFGLKAGKGLGVIGPSASGKSSLARASSACGRPRAARSGSTARRSTSGRPSSRAAYRLSAAGC